MTLPDLTPAQRRVGDLLATGATNKQIGAKLYITEDTVKSHVKAILRALSAHNRAHAATMLLAAQRGHEALAPILALIEAAPQRPDCRYAIAGIGERVLIDVEELRRAVAESTTAA